MVVAIHICHCCCLFFGLFLSMLLCFFQSWYIVYDYDYDYDYNRDRRVDIETYSSVECDVILDGFQLLLSHLEALEEEEEEKANHKHHTNKTKSLSSSASSLTSSSSPSSRRSGKHGQGGGSLSTPRRT